MRRHVGFALQLATLVFLPLLILWQLMFGFPLLVMPGLTLLAALLFMAGHYLREK